jgi:hypothetical protein
LPGEKPWRINMVYIDANVILRYLLKDNDGYFIKAKEIIEKEKTAEQNNGDSAAPGDITYDTSGSGDVIGIISVDPDSGLADRTEYIFTVNTAYKLKSADNAELNIGFNTENAFAYSLIPEAAAPVSKGSGEYTFTVSAIAKNWGTSGTFKVYVNLAENHDPDPPRIFVDSTKIIDVE